MLGFIILPAPGILYAQGATAQISGTVRDQSGAVLPGVDVTATQIDTGVARSVASDAAGSFTLTNLAVGPYRLQATLPGFRAFEQTGIVLQVNASPTINVALSLGDVAETISVVGRTPLIETRTPSIGQVIENERIAELRSSRTRERSSRRASCRSGAQRYFAQHGGRDGISVAVSGIRRRLLLYGATPQPRTTTSTCRCRFQTPCANSASRPARRPPATACTRARRSAT